MCVPSTKYQVPIQAASHMSTKYHRVPVLGTKCAKNVVARFLPGGKKKGADLQVTKLQNFIILYHVIWEPVVITCFVPNLGGRCKICPKILSQIFILKLDLALKTGDRLLQRI